MRRLAILLTLASAPAWADVSFELWDSYSGNKLLIDHPHQRHRKVYISGAKMATMENDIVQVSDQDNDEMILIDHQTRRFARIRLAEAKQLDQQGFDGLGKGMRLDVVESEVPDIWNGMRVTRSVIVGRVPAQMTGLGVDTEVRITQFVSTELPGWRETMERLKGHDARFDQELSALIQTMAANDLDFAKDVQTARGKVQTLALPVRTVNEVRLAPESKVANAVVNMLQGQSLMRWEEEMSGLRGDPVDPGVFEVPPADYQEIEMIEMLKARAQRNGM